ncbi:proline-rich protein HaeIII subfamily 1-like [Photinus pyralis]|uniref:Uncharacterized protein n=1 Tax=Photinus pyralis TaxID=7054 RepID=A0A1Y1LAT3_PHOPY|nr:proline-rich protein HaeIII subfamily 1-like [Photinus pyralis]
MRRLAFILAVAVLVNKLWALSAAENEPEDEEAGGQSGKNYRRNCAPGRNSDSTPKPSKKPGLPSSPQNTSTSPLPPQSEPEKKEARRPFAYPNWNLGDSPFEEPPRPSWQRPYVDPRPPNNVWDYQSFRPPYNNFGYMNNPPQTPGRFPAQVPPYLGHDPRGNYLPPPFGNNRMRPIGYRSSSSADEDIFREILATWPEGHNSVYHDPDSGKSYGFLWTPLEN